MFQSYEDKKRQQNIRFIHVLDIILIGLHLMNAPTIFSMNAPILTYSIVIGIIQ